MSVELSQVWQENVFFLKLIMQCEVIQVTYVYQTKSKILTYRKDYKVLENKLYYDFKWTFQFNHKKNCRISTLNNLMALLFIRDLNT
jgi:hypothetical protein